MFAQTKQLNLLVLLLLVFLKMLHISGFHKSLVYLMFLLISASISFPAVSQHSYILDKTTRFEKMGAEEGLSTGYTSCIHQDKYGFIWIGSQYGLNLYDGYEVKVFNVDPKNNQSIFEGSILNIFEEDDGTMWFCTFMGMSKFNRADYSFTNYIPDTVDVFNRRNGIQNIQQSGDDLWVDAWKGLFRFNKETGEFRPFGKDTLNPSRGIYGINSNYIFIDGSGILWVSSNEPGSDVVISRFNKDTETFTHYQSELSNLNNSVGKDVRSMMEDKGGTIWVATWGGGLLEIIDKKKGKFRQYVHDENDTNSINHNNLYKVFEDSKGNIWIGGETGFALLNKKTGRFTNYQIPKRTDNPKWVNAINDITESFNGELLLRSWEGFFRFNPSTKKLLQYLDDPENPNGLSDNNVRDVLIDKNGQVWVVTHNVGVNRMDPFSNSFRRVQKNPTLNNSISSNYVSRIFGDSKGNLWVGCYIGGGLNKTKMNQHKVFDNFEHFVFDANDPKSISGNAINALCEDQDQIMWFGTFNGLNRYDSNTKKFTRYQHNPDDSTTISSNAVEAIFEDSDGTFWVGTRNGLNIMDKKTGIFRRILNDEKDSASILSADIRVIFEDSYGEIWFGGKNLERLNKKDTSFIHYFQDYIKVKDFQDIFIESISEDDSANLWIGNNKGGLLKYHRVDNTFTTITTNNGLPSNNIAALEIDDNGYIWISTTQGISRIDPRDYSIKNYDVEDGLVSKEFIDRSSYKDKDGWLYFGGRDGLNIFHPDSLKENTYILPVYITSLHIGELQRYFEKPLFEMETIELAYDENNFSFDFVALNYINPKKNQFAYMLEGYDKEWIYVGNKRTANYTNMSPGEYTFRVKGSNNDGYWNEEGASLAVIIYPPIWKTWWAYGAYAFIFFGLLYLFRRYELNRLHLKQNLEINQVETEKLAELDVEKNKFFSNISHEFRTPLTLILGPLEKLIVGNKNEKERDQLNLVKRNARRLQTLISQLLSLSKLESGKMKLKARPENIVKLTRLFLQSFDSMAEDRGIQLVFESDAEEHIIYVDTLKFEKVTNNLLSNAFKFTESGGKIKVSIAPLSPPMSGDNARGFPLEGGSRGVQIKLSDTGIGIHKEKLPHVFDRFYQVDEEQMKTNLGTGIGLALTKELIELHHGTITVDSEAEMGTTFTVVLPMGKEHLSEDEIFEPTRNGSEMEDDLLNDDYLFVQDAVSKTELKTEVPEDSSLPLLLIVEDNEDMRAYIKNYLIDSYNILEAANGKDGAEIAIEHLPDLIVSDLMMPFMNGNEMTNQLKNDERTSHIPIILLTAKSSTASKLEGLETGADEFLTKPFDADELLVRIKNLIEQRRKLRVLLSKHIGDVSQTRIIKESAGKAMSKMDEQFLEKAKDVVDEQMADPDFGVELFAEKMAMSRIQLHRKLTSLTDNSAGDLIREIRLVKAVELLKQGELNVTQVSYEVGISSLSYFAKAFKEKYGVPPSEFS